MSFDVARGQAPDAPHLEGLLDQVQKQLPQLDEMVADKAYAGGPQIDACVNRDLFPQVPKKSNAIDPRPIDSWAYQSRNEVEQLIGKAKQYRRIATRCDKLSTTFKGFLGMEFTMIALNAP